MPEMVMPMVAYMLKQFFSLDQDMNILGSNLKLMFGYFFSIPRNFKFSMIGLN